MYLPGWRSSFQTVYVDFLAVHYIRLDPQTVSDGLPINKFILFLVICMPPICICLNKYWSAMSLCFVHFFEKVFALESPKGDLNAAFLALCFQQKQVFQNNHPLFAIQSCVASHSKISCRLRKLNVQLILSFKLLTHPSYQARYYQGPILYKRTWNSKSQSQSMTQRAI